MQDELRRGRHLLPPTRRKRSLRYVLECGVVAPSEAQGCTVDLDRKVVIVAGVEVVFRLVFPEDVSGDLATPLGEADVDQTGEEAWDADILAGILWLRRAAPSGRNQLDPSAVVTRSRPSNAEVHGARGARFLCLV